MATPADIARVRLNTNEPNNVDPYTDAYIGGLIDSSGVAGASAIIWEQKAASYSTKVDVTEAGASHKFSDLFDNAQKMIQYWRDQEEAEGGPAGRVKIKVIERG